MPAGIWPQTIGTPVRKKFAGYGWYDGRITSCSPPGKIPSHAVCTWGDGSTGVVQREEYRKIVVDLQTQTPTKAVSPAQISNDKLIGRCVQSWFDLPIYGDDNTGGTRDKRVYGEIVKTRMSSAKGREYLVTWQDTEMCSPGWKGQEWILEGQVKRLLFWQQDIN